MFTCEHIAKLQSNVCAIITHALLMHRCWGSSLVQVGDALQGGYNVFHGYVSVAITYTLSQAHHQHYAYYIYVPQISFLKTLSKHSFSILFEKTIGSV